METFDLFDGSIRNVANLETIEGIPHVLVMREDGLRWLPVRRIETYTGDDNE